jgi:ectoine hydroxylase-related dioxygenase (phytanoyl-CoA dioxygenase family)
MQSQLALGNQNDGSIDLTTQEKAIELFHAHGALWLKDVFDSDFIDTLAAAYEERYTSQRVSVLKKRHAIVGDHRFMITVDIQAPFNDPQLFDNPNLTPILRGLLGDQCLISSFGSVVTFPGADAQPIHFDHPPLFYDESMCVALPPHAITMVVPLVDLTEQTGSTAIWEGSHRKVGARDQLRQLMNVPDFEGSVTPMAKRGDVYFMDYRVIHGGTENPGENARPILYVVYSRPWFRDGFNFTDQAPISITASERKRLPKSSQRLFAGVAE